MQAGHANECLATECLECGRILDLTLAPPQGRLRSGRRGSEMKRRWHQGLRLGVWALTRRFEKGPPAGPPACWSFPESEERGGGRSIRESIPAEAVPQAGGSDVAAENHAVVATPRRPPSSKNKRKEEATSRRRFETKPVKTNPPSSSRATRAPSSSRAPRPRRAAPRVYSFSGSAFGGGGFMLQTVWSARSSGFSRFHFVPAGRREVALASSRAGTTPASPTL